MFYLKLAKNQFVLAEDSPGTKLIGLKKGETGRGLLRSFQRLYEGIEFLDLPTFLFAGLLVSVESCALNLAKSTSANLLTERSVVRTRPAPPLDFPCLDLGNLAVSQPSCFSRVAWQLGTESLSGSKPLNPALTMSPRLVMKRLQSTRQARRTDQQSISTPELPIFHKTAI
ncbi:hypothetical protein CSKR_112999, partial [Clonorchis sinensis]